MTFLLQLPLLRACTGRLHHPGLLGAVKWTSGCGWRSRLSSTFKPYIYKHPQNATTIMSRCHSNGGTSWLWEANDRIQSYIESMRNGTRVGAIEYTFNSVRPLEEEHFQRAFEHFIKVLPNMRTVLRQRGDTVWYCQLHKPKIDFKVMSNEGSFNEDCFQLLDQGFQDTDPLPWKARLVQRGPEAPCYVEGVKEMYPYQSDLYILFNHAFSDGIDFQPLTKCLLESLNCILGGISLSNNEYGVFENNMEFEILLNQRRETLLQDQARFDLIQKSLPLIGDIPLVFQAFPRPEVSKVVTKHLLRTVDPQIMKALHSKCFDKGVTFNSFAIAVYNVALAELMNEAGMIKECYDINSLIYVNSRRFCNTKKHLLGNYVTTLTYTSKVNGNVRNSFWEYCKRVNHDLHLFYGKDGFVLDQTIVQEIMNAEYPTFNSTDNPRPISHDYSSTYIGDISKMLPGTGEHVQLTNLVIFQNTHNSKNALFQEIYSFRGRTQYNFCYPNNCISDETANLIANRIFHLFDVIGK